MRSERPARSFNWNCLLGGNCKGDVLVLTQQKLSVVESIILEQMF